MVHCNAIVASNVYVKNNIGKLVPNYKFYDVNYVIPVTRIFTL
jgi:hypothetical protein